jgi:hypothetical protein
MCLMVSCSTSLVQVRLPFACALGKESLLQTLVESDVPVQAYGGWPGNSRNDLNTGTGG